MLQYSFSQYLYFDTKKGLKALKSSGLYEASNLVEHNLWLQIPPIENEGLFIDCAFNNELRRGRQKLISAPVFI